MKETIIFQKQIYFRLKGIKGLGGDIEKELLRLSPGTSYDVFTQVNSLLTGNKAWMESASDIKLKMLSMRDNPTIVNGNIYQSGATHDDHSKHIDLGNNDNQLKLEDK